MGVRGSTGRRASGRRPAPPRGAGLEGTEVVICFSEAARGSREVEGTVLLTGTAQAVPFHGWLQLLGHLERLSGAASRNEDGLAQRQASSQPDLL